MASTISRNLRLRHIYTTFNSSIKRFSNSPFHSLPETSPPTQTSPLSPISQHFFSQNLRAFSPINNRFLCTSTTTNPSLNPPPNSDAKTTPSTGSASSGNDGGQSSEGSQNSEQQGKSVRGGPVSWMSFFLLICTGAGLLFYFEREKRWHIEEINNASNAVRQGPSVGKAAIGGPFNLIDHNGKPVTDKNFLGRWHIFYFGFTHCPDICPDELQKLALAIDKIKEKSGLEVVPVFISVDPERDTVEQVSEYIKEFHPKLIGLTGTPEEVKKTARAYRVYYMKTEEEGSDYLVDHSIVMYLMDPNMQFVKFFGKNLDAAALTDGVIKEIKQHKKASA